MSASDKQTSTSAIGESVLRPFADIDQIDLRISSGAIRFWKSTSTKLALMRPSYVAGIGMDRWQLHQMKTVNDPDTNLCHRASKVRRGPLRKKLLS